MAEAQLYTIEYIHKRKVPISGRQSKSAALADGRSKVFPGSVDIPQQYANSNAVNDTKLQKWKFILSNE
jgi:hypothetical protein